MCRVIKSRRMRWVGHVAYTGEMRNAYTFWSERPHRRPRHKWKDNTGMDLVEIEWEDVDWMHLAQDRDQWRAPMNTVMNLRVP